MSPKTDSSVRMSEAVVNWLRSRIRRRLTVGFPGPEYSTESKAAAIVVARGEVIGKIGALDGRQFAQPRADDHGVGARLVISREELGNHFLALADQKQIDEIGDRLGIEENRRSRPR